MRFTHVLYSLMLFTLWVGVSPGCIGKKGERGDFQVRGVEWVGDRVGVLGVYTRYEVLGGGLIGERLEPLYSRDVMFFVDPSTIHQDERGLWVVEADSVWVIHQEPSIIQGYDLRKDPKGRGWWVAGYLFDESSPYGQPKVMLYDSTFSQILLSLDGGGISFFPSGDSILFGRDDTVRVYDLIRKQEMPLFRGGGLMEVSPDGKIYIATSDYRLLRWEGADSFTVIDSPVVSFGLKGDTLVTIPYLDIEQILFKYFDAQTLTIIDTLIVQSLLDTYDTEYCTSTLKFRGNHAVACMKASRPAFCTVKSGGWVCTDRGYYTPSVP